MDAVAAIPRAAFDDRLPWLAGLHTQSKIDLICAGRRPGFARRIISKLTHSIVGPESDYHTPSMANNLLAFFCVFDNLPRQCQSARLGPSQSRSKVLSGGAPQLNRFTRTMQLTTLIVTALASFLIATTAKADRPYVGRWEHRTEPGFLETAEFTADGRFSFLYFPNSTMEGTYREIRPGILRLKLTNSDVLGNDLGSGEMTIQWEIDNGCLIETYENGNSFKYFPVLETEEESSIDSEKQSRGATTPPIATPAPRATPGDEFGTRLILAVRSALDSHDWKALTGMTVEGETNYFGHQNATDDYIAGDMQSDSRRYGISYAFGLMAITQLPLPAFCTMTR